MAGKKNYHRTIQGVQQFPVSQLHNNAHETTRICKYFSDTTWHNNCGLCLTVKCFSKYTAGYFITAFSKNGFAEIGKR